MPCLKVPVPTLPELPSPFSIPELVVPPIGTPELELCCKLPPFATPPIPLPIPGLSLLLAAPGLAALITAAVGVVASYVNRLPLKCPVE